MKTIIKGARLIPLWMACFILLTGFDRPGAHSIQVYFDNDLILERYVDSKWVAPVMEVDPSGKYKNISVRYNECGRTVEGRKLTALDNNNVELKSWKFEGASSGFSKAMTCQVKEIIDLAKAHKSDIKLRYTSNDFTEGMHFMTLSVAGTTRVSVGE